MIDLTDLTKQAKSRDREGFERFAQNHYLNKNDATDRVKIVMDWMYEHDYRDITIQDAIKFYGDFLI